jgi:hypothetical protein
MTELEKKKSQHEKELKSFRNRMCGSNLIWFDSLSKKRQYDLLFEWKFEKHSNKIQKPEVRFVRKRKPYRKFELIKVINYPANLKYFIREKRNQNRWRVQTSAIRNAAIDILLGNNKDV